MNSKIPLAACIGLLLVGTTAHADKAAKNRTTSSTAEAPAAAVEVDAKTLRKLSMGIGEEVEDFTVTKVQEIDSTVGYKGQEYTVQTRDGKKFKCEVLAQSKFGKIASWGMNSEVSAMCTEFSGRASAAAKPSGTGGKSTKKASDESTAAAATASAPVKVDDKTLRKISMGIGEEVEDFKVTKAQEIDSTVGYKGMEYTVQTTGGKKYKCEVLAQSKFGKIASWGMNSEVSAMCTDFSKGAKDDGKVSRANCTPPLLAAGKCKL